MKKASFFNKFYETNKQGNKKEQEQNKQNAPQNQIDYTNRLFYIFLCAKSHKSKDVNFQKPIYSMSLLNK